MLFGDALPFAPHCFCPGTVVQVRKVAAETHLTSVYPMLKLIICTKHLILTEPFLLLPIHLVT